MFRKIRREDRQLSTEAAMAILTKGSYGIMSTFGENGYSYGVPLSYVYTNGGVYFHCATVGQKLDNIDFNNRVSFCVVTQAEPLPEMFSMRYESVVAFGTAVEVFNQEKTDALLDIVGKYAPEHLEAGKEYIHRAAEKTRVFKIIIEHLTGKARE